MFVASAIFSGAFEIFSIVVLFLNLFEPQSNLNTALSTIQMILAIVLNALILLSIFVISKEVGATKIQSKSIVNLVVTAIAFLLVIFSAILPNPNAQSRCFLVGYIAMIVYTVFTLITIFNCYASICYEGDENMDKETGIKPLDFLNKLLNKAMNKNKDIDKTKNDKTGKKK